MEARGLTFAGGMSSESPTHMHKRASACSFQVVDAAGESLAAGATALGVRLQRAITRRRDLDAPEGTAPYGGGSPMDTPRGGGGGHGNGYGGAYGCYANGASADAAAHGKRGSRDEEKLGLLAAVDGGGANGKAVGGSTATPTTVTITFDSASSDSGSVALTLPRPGQSAAAVAVHADRHHPHQGLDEEEADGPAAGPFELDAVELRVSRSLVACAALLEVCAVRCL